MTVGVEPTCLPPNGAATPPNPRNWWMNVCTRTGTGPKRIGRDVRTIKRWRGQGMPTVLIDGTRFVREGALLAWFRSTLAASPIHQARLRKALDEEYGEGAGAGYVPEPVERPIDPAYRATPAEADEAPRGRNARKRWSSITSRRCGSATADPSTRAPPGDGSPPARMRRKRPLHRRECGPRHTGGHGIGLLTVHTGRALRTVRDRSQASVRVLGGEAREELPYVIARLATVGRCPHSPAPSSGGR